MKDVPEDAPTESFQISSSMHCTLFIGDFVRNSTCTTNTTRQFSDICSFREILVKKFPDEHFPSILPSRDNSFELSPKLAPRTSFVSGTTSPKTSFVGSTLPTKESVAEQHRLCTAFLEYVSLCHHVLFSKDTRIFLSASERAYREHVAKVFPDGNHTGFRQFKDAQYSAAKRAFLDACERYKADTDLHAAAISGMYAIQALAMQRYWSDIRVLAEFCLPIFKDFTDIYGVVRVLCYHGRACMFLGDSNAALTSYHNASAVVDKYKSKELRVVVCKHLADFHHRFGDIQDSISLMKKELSVFQSTADLILHMDFKLFLSQLLLQYGSFDEAFALSTEITAQIQALPEDILKGKYPGRNRVWIDDRLNASAFLVQSKYHLLQKDVESADAFATKALSIARSDNSVGISCLVVLGKCQLFKCLCLEALKIFEKTSRSMSFASCDVGLKAQVYKGLMLSHFLCGQHEKAASSLSLLRDTAMSSFDRLTHSQSLRLEAVIARSAGDFDSAQLALEKCLSLVGSVFSDYTLRTEACKVRLLCSEVYRTTGNFGLSHKYVTEAKTILESQGQVDFVLQCQLLRCLGELELLRSKAGEGIRLLEQALDLVQNTSFVYDTAMCLGILAIGHAMVGDFLRAGERLKRMKALVGSSVNSESQCYERVASNVVSRLQVLSASASANTSFTIKAREDDRPLTLVMSSEQITVYDGLVAQKQKKNPVLIVSHRLDDSVFVAPSPRNKKGIVLQGSSATPTFIFKAEDSSARSIILELTGCLVSNNRPSPYLTTISFCESDTLSPMPIIFGGSTVAAQEQNNITLIPRSMKGDVVPVRGGHVDCQLLDLLDGSTVGTAVLSPSPLPSGAYPIHIEAAKQGRMHLHVRLIGHPVVGSPLEINVMKPVPSPMRSSISFYRSALQNEVNFFVFHLCDHSGFSFEPSEHAESMIKFQFRYSNGQSAVDVTHLAYLKNAQMVSAVFPHPGHVVLYVDFLGEGFVATSVSVRCVSSSVLNFMSDSSFAEASALLAAAKPMRKFPNLNVSLLESTECRRCFQIYLSFREVFSALVDISHGEHVCFCCDSPL